jgi:hypothetical protein
VPKSGDQSPDDFNIDKQGFTGALLVVGPGARSPDDFNAQTIDGVIEELSVRDRSFGSLVITTNAHRPVLSAPRQ